MHSTSAMMAQEPTSTEGDPVLEQVRTDLVAEQEALDAVVADLDPAAWATPTPSPGWTVADQVAHLTYFDGTAAQAAADPDAFAASLDALLGAMAEGEAAVDAATVGPYRAMAPAELLAAWRAGRAELAEAAAGLAEGDRVPWYGPSMGAASFLTARLMECWAHGQDVVDALGATRPATDRLRHVAQLGVITRWWSYANRGLEAPEVPVRVSLVAPGSGDTWTWGDASDPESIEGPAEDFCLVVTQRRHVDDTALVVAGEAARDWMLRAQAFAGPATDGPAAG